MKRGESISSSHPDLIDVLYERWGSCPTSYCPIHTKKKEPKTAKAYRTIEGGTEGEYRCSTTNTELIGQRKEIALTAIGNLVKEGTWRSIQKRNIKKSSWDFHFRGISFVLILRAKGKMSQLTEGDRK